MYNDFCTVVCVADMNITGALDQCLTDLALPEVFVQRAKQMSLIDHSGFLGLRPGTKLGENRALIYRFNIPAEYTEGVMHRIIEVTDLKMGGRGCIFSFSIDLNRGTPLVFDEEKLDRLCGKTDGALPEEHALMICTVPRGSADTLAQAMLELGMCVPVIFFGYGVGLRDKLGLLRITIPVEKEIIWLLVSRSDAELVEKTLIPRARLDVPGRGFLYRSFVHAPAVNLRIRQGKRLHAATMEQVIAALDEVRGSSDWRRHGTRHGKTTGTTQGSIGSRGLFFIGEKEDVETFRRTAMANGARGATLNDLEMRSYSVPVQEQARESHLRELCDIITSREVEEKLREPLAGNGFFENGKTCVYKAFNVELPAVIRAVPPNK